MQSPPVRYTRVPGLRPGAPGHGGCSSARRASACEAEGRGCKSRHSPSLPHLNVESPDDAEREPRFISARERVRLPPSGPTWIVNPVRHRAPPRKRTGPLEGLGCESSAIRATECSAGAARCVRDAEVVGAIPTTPIPGARSDNRRTPLSHSGDLGAIPNGSILPSTRARSSGSRALPRHGRGRRCESDRAHH